MSSTTDGANGRRNGSDAAGWAPPVINFDRRSKMDFGLEAVFNILLTHIPILRLRMAWLRRAGAVLDPDVVVFTGTQVLHAPGLRVGSRSSIGSRSYIDARGGIDIGHDVNIGSDTHILTADHDLKSPGFEERFSPVRIGDRASLGTRSLILRGVTIGTGGGVAAGAVVHRDVDPYAIVGGVPAKQIGTRPQNLDYKVAPPPRLA